LLQRGIYFKKNKRFFLYDFDAFPM
jgi:hypothetical protein